MLSPLLFVLAPPTFCSQTACNFGFMISDNMAFHKHISIVCHSVYVEVRQISSICQCLTIEATKTLCCAFVLSKLDYCNSLLSSCLLYLLSRLQKVQCNETVFKAHKCDHVQPFLQAIHTLLVQARTDFKLSTICHNVSDSSPVYLSDLLISADTWIYFISPRLKQKPLANTLSLTVRQSNGILYLLTSDMSYSILLHLQNCKNKK